MNYTTIEQSKHLLELGLNPDTADMHYPDYYFDGNANGPCNTTYKEQIENLLHNYINPNIKRILPCWSVGALLELMPLSIVGWDNETYTRYFVGNCAEYATGTCKYDKGLISIPSDSMLKCVYSMICWLLQNNYIKTE